MPAKASPEFRGEKPLDALIEDGTVDDEERAQLRFLHKVLSTLGWSVTG